jgi:hypothetical protein
MSRGNRRQDIYLDDVDRQDFLKTLAEACRKSDWPVLRSKLLRRVHKVHHSRPARAMKTPAPDEGTQKIPKRSLGGETPHCGCPPAGIKTRLLCWRLRARPMLF